MCIYDCMWNPTVRLLINRFLSYLILSCLQCPCRIENFDDIEGKDDVWNETECSEQQPDDMAILVAWFACYNESVKLKEYAYVSCECARMNF